MTQSPHFLPTRLRVRGRDKVRVRISENALHAAIYTLENYGHTTKPEAPTLIPPHTSMLSPSSPHQSSGLSPLAVDQKLQKSYDMLCVVESVKGVTVYIMYVT